MSTLTAVDLRSGLTAQQPPNLLAAIRTAADTHARRAAIQQGNSILSYADLLRESQAFARDLSEAGLEPAEVVGLHCERSIAAVVGLLGIFHAGGIALLLDSQNPQTRRQAMLNEARTCLVAEALSNSNRPVGLRACRNRRSPALARTKDVPPKSDEPCYIFTTSGTTGRPKLVLGGRRALANFVCWEQLEFSFTEQDRAAQLANLGFDACLKDILPTLLAGGTICIPTFNPYENPVATLEWFGTSGVTVVQTIPSVLDTWLVASQRSGPTLSSLRLLCLSGEPLSSSLVNRFREAFPECRAEIVNLYGPTETTMIKSFYRVPNEPREGVLPLGDPLPGSQLLVVDGQDRPCGVGELGEIVIRTRFGTLGYINAEESDKKKFYPNPFRDDSEDMFFRTGDLGRYEPNGSVSIAGRVDEQVKIHGTRIHPAEVTAVLASHPEVQACVVVASKSDQINPVLVAYVVPSRQEALSPQEIRRYMGTRLPLAMVPTHVVLLDELPLTTNGKVNKAALPQPKSVHVDQARSGNKPSSHVERKLAAIWQELLGREVVSTTDDFFELGGHSLLLVQVLSRVRTAFQVELSIRSLFENPTLARLSQLIQVGKKGDRLPAPALERIERSSPIPLSLAQEGLWFLHQLDPESPSYNMVGVLRFSGYFDLDLVERCMHELVSRHETLRTIFVERDGVAWQAIGAPSSIRVRLHSIPPASQLRAEEAALLSASDFSRRPFDLKAEPPLRVLAIRVSSEHHLLVLNIHHLAADGHSWNIILREFAQLWNAFSSGKQSPLPDLPIGFPDFAAWQQKWLSEDLLMPQLEYWRRQLRGAPRHLDIPTDYPRPSILTSEGSTHTFSLDHELSTRLSELGRQEHVTPFILLLAAFNLLLFRLARQDQIVVGTDSSARRFIELEGVVGFLVNTHALVSDLSGNPAFFEVVGRVRDVVLNAQENADVSFETLVRDLRPPREQNRSPLFQHMFRMAPPRTELPAFIGTTMTEVQGTRETSKFDLTLSVRLLAGRIIGEFEFRTDLFSKDRIRILAEQFHSLLRQVAEEPHRRLADFELRDESSPITLTTPLRTNTRPDLRARLDLASRRSPETTAVATINHAWNYSQLTEKVQELSQMLDLFSIKQGDVVALHGGSNFATVASFLAVLKAHAVMIPLDHAEPLARKKQMLRKVRPKLLISIGAGGDLCAAPQFVLSMDGEVEGMKRKRAQSGERLLHLREEPAYVFFTSGTGGAPKAVLGTFSGLEHFVDWEISEFKIEPSDRVALTTSLSFDAILREVFVPLAVGAAIWLFPNRLETEAVDFWPWLENNRISVLHTVPSRLATWLEVDRGQSRLTHLRLLCLSGEPLSSSLVNRFREAFPECRAEIVNLYGPTETTMIKSFYRVPNEPREGVLPLGDPLPGSQLLVVDGQDRPCGVGELGEIVIRTRFGTLGYINAEESDKKKFYPNPFRDDSEDMFFRTGDLGRYEPNGSVSIAGRVDEQVKIHGTRIHPAEVTAVLASHPEVQACVVVASKSDQINPVLVAYVVPSRQEALSPQEIRRYMGTRLPLAMVPTHVVLLDELPLTTNGKVNKAALPQPKSVHVDQARSGNKPSSHVERKLAAIWQELLGREVVSTTDDFFELGGHSLLATLLVTRIRAELHVDVGLRHLFENPTVAGLAGMLDQMGELRARPAALIQLRSGSGTPIVCVHPAGGGAGCYNELARAFKGDHPILAFESVGSDRQSRTERTLEGLAARYVKELDEDQPIHFVGWSIGGLLGFEMARQLAAKGSQVGVVALIDTRPPGSGRYMMRDSFDLARSFAQDVLALSDGRKQLTCEDRSRITPHNVHEFLGGKLDQGGLELGQDLRRRWREFVWNHARAARYIGGSVDANGLLFVATARPDSDEGSHKEWNQLFSRGLEVVRTNADHYSILRHPTVGSVGEEVLQRISLVEHSWD